MVKCPECGKEVENNNFCGNCGAEIIKKMFAQIVVYN